MEQKDPLFWRVLSVSAQDTTTLCQPQHFILPSEADCPNSSCWSQSVDFHEFLSRCKVGQMLESACKRKVEKKHSEIKMRTSALTCWLIATRMILASLPEFTSLSCLGKLEVTSARPWRHVKGPDWSGYSFRFAAFHQVQVTRLFHPRRWVSGYRV